MSVNITDITTYKRIVTAGNDEVWYEMSAGDMIELAPATGDIDTSDQLNTFELFQKMFVVNGANLKVADFANIKLTHTALTTAHAKGDTLTQATSNATMSVDFTNTAKTATYGYVTSGTWNCTNTVTGSGSGTGFTPTGINGMLTHTALTTVHAADDVLTQATSGATMTVEYTDAEKTHTWGRITSGTFNTTNQVTGSGAGTAFTPTATDTSPPLWYDWTVYPGGSSGTMPAKAYLGCAYQGRAVLSANPNTPEQWYMSEVYNPFDFNYTENVSLSAIAGSDGDLGQAGDIIRALIPYRDDYVILGCANTIKVIVGNPCDGGTFSEVDLTRGIFGAKSWCFDGQGNLYFWSTVDGLCKTPVGFGTTECLSAKALPNILVDEGVDPSTHRICLAYDRDRYGVVVTITLIADGTNSNYFYSLKSEGFFPFSLPEECGAYSLYYYPANDSDYAGLLYGCKDGFIRKLDNTSKNDNVGATTEAIDAYVTLPIVKMSEEDKEGKIRALIFETSGGEAAGEYADTDQLTYSVFVGDDAETVAERIRDGATPVSTGTITGTGRSKRVGACGRGGYAGIKISDATASKSFALNRLQIEVAKGGNI